MLTTRVVVSITLIGTLAVGAGTVRGQNYSNKPIRFVTGEVGGGNDFTARLIAPGISSSLGQQVIVENRGGAFYGAIVSQAQPDGHTLLLTSSAFFVEPFFRQTPYDVVKDFSPVTLTTTSPNILVVNASLPVKSVKDLIALAKAKPGELNYASSTPGGTTHLAAELFKHMAGVNIVGVRYKGGGPALTGVMSGEVQMIFNPAGSVAPHLKSGKVRALAVTSAEPSALVPDLPTIAASGVPGYGVSSITAIFAPAKTPAAIVNRLNIAIVRFLNTPEAKERFLSSGVEAVGSSPQQLADLVKSEVAMWGKLIKDAGIRIE